jgi:hypothetical protein
MPTTPRCRCWRKLGGYGPTCAMTAHSEAKQRQRCHIATVQTAKGKIRVHTSDRSVASCKLMVMLGMPDCMTAA